MWRNGKGTKILVKKKALVFIQAGTEHWLQFCFNVCGLLSVLNSKIATLSHLKLFNALLEMFAIHNPCLPIERALQSNVHDRDIYLRGTNKRILRKRSTDRLALSINRKDKNYKKRMKNGNMSVQIQWW